jgi:hypothetical protein
MPLDCVRIRKAERSTERYIMLGFIGLCLTTMKYTEESRGVLGRQREGANPEGFTP